MCDYIWKQKWIKLYLFLKNGVWGLLEGTDYASKYDIIFAIAVYTYI